ncbi:brefeldin A-inhibited guanine nucleotide-exchange protein 1 isoform X1 [Punica granatum]|uniref:Brefeldin A-inhibited guanine nucleotide-exchange protein 1 isoform X1 n=1 Tax=Punica granatum TaxID=22663 RepID=A0A6P8CLL3_PUNGR|nr:brefeldin A-inhibited guanine nucleotide-exchange protein 1 isoform X1 [Punica granatum]XP_031382233.1 brefeldin A-inhibited guanine nucleotide-exchange protein 1 isoform X1 [Punica granatum]
MSASQALGGQSSCGRAIGPSLDKIIKNAAWRKHSAIVAACKSALDRLETLPASAPTDPASPLLGLSLADANLVLHPLVLALEAAYGKIAEPALECAFKLFSLNLVHADIADCGDQPSAILRLIQAVCKSGGIGEEAVELAVLRVLLSAVRSPCVLIRGDCLVHIVKTCYNVYLGGQNGTNQICAKSVLAQIVVIVFARTEADSLDVRFKTVSVSELLEFADKNLNEGSSIQFCQNFLNEVVDANDGAAENKNLEFSLPTESQNGDASVPKEDDKGEAGNGELNDGPKSVDGTSKIREDGFLLFKNLCKLSMKFSSQDQSDDQILLRGKIVSLELLKVIMDNGGPIWRTNERFLSAVKQFLCLSLLKNSALSVMSIFQLQCSIFMNLLTKFRSGLKAEIGIFFPMLVLRVLENVLQPSFLQKMTVLNLLEKISQDPQIIIDVFVNYDCDVDSPNIFERTVNGLLKTALGPPAGSATTLSPAQDVTFRHESVKCLVRIIKSMGSWMDQQLIVGDLNPPRGPEGDNSTENHSTPNGEDGTAQDFDIHTDGNSEFYDAVTLEQRRAYKIELQKGITLFNRKPSKGIDFLISAKKIGGSPEDVAAFLKNTSGLSETMIGDYLGDRDDFPLKVMHAYVDSFNFKGKDFGEAIRFFLRGFKLPGEAQKIDRIMEKFAERYCKCNPNSFTSADTAYVLAYSVILLNTDAHNNMVKDKMSKADFIRNNRGIDDGKDLPEEFLSTLYDQIVKNEIKMSSDTSAQQSKQANSLNKLLGLDGILNLVIGKQTEEKALGANGLLIRHIQEQFKAKSGKSESIYHSVTDVAILRFMVEVCWGPMLAAFSVTLDQSDDRLATAQCLQGFRYAVHVTAVMGMQTQRDAFMTSIAKFTYLHCAADMKQKNVDAVKAIISIAIEDGNYLQEAWEHILTCLSRIEHLQLLGEGAPTDASFLTSSNAETQEKTPKSGLTSLKKKGTMQNPAVMAVVRGGSYDSTTVGINASGSGLVTPEQINNFISNLNLLDQQIGNFELNHVFAHSQRLNSEAIVAFVRALCKVSMSELQSPTDPRVFCLTKLVEIAHYNMNRIRLVWSRIWNVLSDFFVSVGLSENLSVAIFVMDSLRQLAMKFLEREELANYNFQNEFLRPFVIIMQKSASAEIRELIVRCISQMVLSRVNNVKSGWKSVFLVFTAAAADERKNIVLLAFETMEKIVREYFTYITETETTTFTDCVRCLLAFTTSRFNSDVSLNAIAFLRFCAVKLAEDGFISNKKSKSEGSEAGEVAVHSQALEDKDENASFWVPLLAGLAKLTSDSRLAIRKSSLEVLFNILKDHGPLFSSQFWNAIYISVIIPIFNSNSDKGKSQRGDEDSTLSTVRSSQVEGISWDSETSSVAAQCLVDLFVTFFDVVRDQLSSVVMVLMGFIKNPVQGTASTGVAATVRLAEDLGSQLSDDEWRQIFAGLKEAAESMVPGFLKLLGTMESVSLTGGSQSADGEFNSDHGLSNDDIEDDSLQTAAYVISRMKSHIAVQLLIQQVVSDLYRLHPKSLSKDNVAIVLALFSSISSHAHWLNSEKALLRKLQRACSVLELSDPPAVHFENESHQNYLNFLKTLLSDFPVLSTDMDIKCRLVELCVEVLQIYLGCMGTIVQAGPADPRPTVCWILPLGAAVKEELAARTSLLVSALKVFTSFDRDTFRRHVSKFFPLLVDLLRSEHSSGEVQLILTNIFQSCIGPLIME